MNLSFDEHIYSMFLSVPAHPVDEIYKAIHDKWLKTKGSDVFAGHYSKDVVRLVPGIGALTNENGM